MSNLYNSESEAKMAASIAQQCTGGMAESALSGSMRGARGIEGPCRENLLGRIRNQRERSEIESRKSARLGELQMLLEKNPEVARILDLLDEVRG